jgi:hypothetical protein
MMNQTLFYCGQQLRVFQRDDGPWICCNDVCAILGIHQHTNPKDGCITTRMDKLRVLVPEGSIFLAVGVQKRGRGLNLLRRDAVERLIELSFRQYAQDFGAWLEENVWKPRPTVLINEWLTNRGFSWPSPKVQRLGRYAREIADQRGMALDYTPAPHVKERGLKIDGQYVNWPVGFLDEIYNLLAG